MSKTESFEKTGKKIMNYYVLFCQSLKIEKLYHTFNLKKDTEAFIPRMERYIRSKDKIVIQNMFPGYLFIKTRMNQTEFDTFLLLMVLRQEKVPVKLKYFI